MIYLINIILFVVLSICGKAQMLASFTSYEDLEKRADWVGIIQIKKQILRKNSFVSSDYYRCNIIHSYKGASITEKINVTFKLVDCSARTNKNGEILKKLSANQGFNIDQYYFVFVSKSAESLDYISVEGAVLPILQPATIHAMQTLSGKKSFNTNIINLSKYYKQQAEHAQIQLGVFSQKKTK